MCEEEKLLKFIDEVSFAVLDVGLYLDTHPCDQCALKYYQKYRELRKCAMEEYEKEYGPLTVDGVESCDYWTWIENPCPWKGGK